MKCSKYRRLLMPYAEGSLPEETSDSMERHIAECESCARELRSLACTVGVLKEFEYPAMEPATDLRSRVLAQISPQPAHRSWWQASRLQAYSAAVAGLLLVAIAGAGMWSMMQRGVEVPAAREVAREADRVHQSAKVAAPPKPQAVVSPRKPTANQIERRSAGDKAAYLPMARMPSYSEGYFLHGGEYDRGGRGMPLGKEEEAHSVRNASAATPTEMGYGVMADELAPPAGPSRQPSQELAASTKQSDSGGTQLFMYRGGPEGGYSAGRPAAAATGDVLSTPSSGNVKGAMTADKPAVRQDFDSSTRVGDRMAAGNAISFAEANLGVDVSALETKLRDFPSSVTTITDLMVKYREAGRPRDEYQMAQRLTKLDPDNSGYWLSRAQAADRVPMPRTAQTCYQRAIKLGLKGEELGRAQERVKVLEKK